MRKLTLSMICSRIVVAVGLTVLLGWQFNLILLRSLIPGLPQITPLAALMLLALASALTLSEKTLAGQLAVQWRWVCWLLVGMVVFAAIWILLQYVLRLGSSLELLLYPQLVRQQSSVFPGRPSPHTALSCLLVGLAVGLSSSPGRMLKRTALTLAIVGATIPWVALFGYASVIRSFFSLPANPGTGMSLITAFCLLTLCLGVMGLWPSEGFLGLLTSPSSGGLLVRRLWPLTIGGPLVLGWLINYGLEAAVFNVAFGLALSWCISSLAFAGLIVWVGFILNQHDGEKEQASIEREKLLAELEESLASLDEKNIELENAILAKDRFLTSMSHELRTPLNAVIGFTGTLLMKLPGPLTPDQEKQLRTIQTSARHLLSLINDLLDLAKIESGKVELTLEVVNCRSVLEEIASILRPLAEAKGLRFDIQLPADNITLYSDRRAFSQIIINLCNNAIKFTEQGEVHLGLVQHRENAHQRTEISVVDTGAGIRLEDQARLFQAFTQVDASSQHHKGTGLGLHLSQKLAALLGGRITLQSEYGKGSTFTLIIIENQSITRG